MSKGFGACVLLIGAFLPQLIATEPWMEAEPIAAATCDAGRDASTGSCHHAMIQKKSSQSRTTPTKVEPVHDKTGKRVSLRSLSNQIQSKYRNPEGVGTSAPLDEAGYKEVANAKNNMEMSVFFLRATRQKGLHVVGESQFAGLIPYYSGEKSVQSFAALEEEIEKTSKEMCSWIATETDVDGQESDVDGQGAPLSEQGYQAVAKLRSPLDMRDFIKRTIREMSMIEVGKGGLMGLLPYHDCEKGARTFKELKSELESAAEKKTWLTYLVDASEKASSKHGEESSKDEHESRHTHAEHSASNNAHDEHHNDRHSGSYQDSSDHEDS